MNKLNVYLANWDVLKIVSPFEIDSRDYLVYDSDGNVYAKGYFKDLHYIDSRFVYYIWIDKKITLGTTFYLLVNNSSQILINVSPSSLLDDFDDLYGYDGDDLGNRIVDNKIFFALWSPHSTFVKLEYYIDGVRYIKDMVRTDKGVFRIDIDFINTSIYYRYIISINNEIYPVMDPYAKYGINNCEFALVSNEKITINTNVKLLKPLNYKEHIIYETNVRDFTIHKNSNIVNKGKFIGIIEEGRTTNGGNPAGLDYLKFLGITTVQFQPIFNIATLDENEPLKKYNWGYDPSHYFVLEGSYSSNIKDPMQVVKDFRYMVSELHKNNIRVSIDVVYNHMYESNLCSLERTVPFYYFRRENDVKWTIQNHAGCGGDFASERYMARKMIIDSILYLVKDLGVDALRFDLMGLIDSKTINSAYEKCKKLRPDIIFYGEGWLMGGDPHDHSELLTMDIAPKYKYIGFFNDRYRNIAKGTGDRAKQVTNGYLLGNLSLVNGFKNIYLGSSYKIAYPRLFANPGQSINYVECHDNCALYDVISSSLKLDNEDEVMEIVNFINKTLLLSFGIPFIHAGQEIGFSKLNHHNTYNEGDRFNNFDYALLDKRFEFAKSVKDFIALRKEMGVFTYKKNIDLSKLVKFEIIEKGIIIEILDSNRFVLIINPSNDILTYQLDESMLLISNKEKKLQKKAVVQPHSLKLYKEQ